MKQQKGDNSMTLGQESGSPDSFKHTNGQQTAIYTVK